MTDPLITLVTLVAVAVAIVAAIEFGIALTRHRSNPWEL